MGYVMAFIFSAVVLSITICYVVKHPQNRLLMLAVGTFIMLAAMVLPFGTMDSLGGIITGFLFSLVKAAQVFLLNAGFDADVSLLDTPRLFAWVYIVALAMLYLAAPLLTASWLLTYSRRARNWIKWQFNRRKEVWIFSEPSEKALLFAEDVMKDEKEDVCVVFCDASSEKDEQIAEIGAIAVKKKIDELDGNYLNRKPSTLLFMAEDEARNLEQTLSFVQKRKDIIKNPTLLYCFTSWPEAGLMLNAIDEESGGKLRFRRIAENRAVVYQELLQVSAAIKANNIEEGTTLHFLIAGCGWIGTEMLKALLWCFVRYDLVIDIIDIENSKDRFFRNCPGLKLVDDGYRINFLPNNDIRTFDIAQITQARDICHAFVALGNDLLNVECAVYLCQAFRRLHLQNEDDKQLNTPEIHVVINNSGKINLNLIDHNTLYNIKPFINGQTYYTTETILNYELEKQTLLNHLCWEIYYAKESMAGSDSRKKSNAQKKVNELYNFIQNEIGDGDLLVKNHAKWRELVLRSDLISSLYKSDYDAWSSRARAVFDKCDWPLMHSAIIEHKRWVRYMLTEGYQFGEKTDHIAKLHKDIGKEADDARDMKYQEVLKSISQANN